VDGGPSIGQETPGHRFGLVRAQPLGLVDQLQLLAFALGILLELARLDADLALRELARARDRHPLAEGHRARSRQKPGQPGDEDAVAVDRRAGHPHDQAEIRAESIVGSQDRCSQRVAPDRSMPALEAPEEAPMQAAWLVRHELLQYL